MKHEDEQPARRTRSRVALDEDTHPLTGARTLSAVRELPEAVNACKRCGLWRSATQGVPGEGRAPSGLMLVGEAPGDQEDLQGHPFVGPAGAMLDRALAEAGMDRNAVYITNAVKHFKFEPRGKRRLHVKPAAVEIQACHWWLEQELRLVSPKLVIALGATAARALLGRVVTIAQTRGSALRHRALDASSCPVLRFVVHPHGRPGEIVAVDHAYPGGRWPQRSPVRARLCPPGLARAG